ncbi:MAG: acetate--CoA ligase family protein [Actinomycetes bacterium]
MGCQADPSSARDLTTFFAPASVCIVGATDDPAKWGHGIARAALRSGAERPVHLVNRSRVEVLGQRAYPTVSSVPGPVDLVVVCVPVSHFADVVDDALAAGARGILAITTGLGEAADEGRAIERDVVARVQQAGAALIGPNCLGLVDNSSEVFLAAGAFPVGHFALLSQSGNLALEMQHWFASYGLGFSRFVSLGNQADVTVVDLIDACVADESTSAIAVYAEDFRDGRAFIAAARRAHDAGKPVVILPAGSGAAATRSALSHTGALTSGLDAILASTAFSGAVVVDSPRRLAQALLALDQPRRLAGRRIGVLTDGGGHGTLAASALERAGLEVPLLSAGQQASLAGTLWPQSSVANPVDLAGFGEQDIDSYARVVSSMMHDPGLDGVLMTGYFGGYASESSWAPPLAEGEVETAARIVEVARSTGRPVVVQSMSVPSPSLDVLTAGGVPVFAAIEDAVGALAQLERREPADLPDLPERLLPPPSQDYVALKAFLSEYGIPVAASIPIESQVELLAAADALAPPYVLKVTGQLHKTEAGGVLLNLADRDALLDGYDVLQERFPGAACVVEPMVERSGGVEILVGVTRDPRFGPLLTVGAGGVTAEVVRDVATTLAPASLDQVLRLLQSLRTWPLLTGFRGAPAVDVEALSRVAASLSVLASSIDEWAEFECNPVLVTEDGAIVLDARVVNR